MVPDTELSAEPGEDWVVFASFDSAHHGEHMFVKLGRHFRSDVRKGRATAVVVTENDDGSLKLRQSRAVTITGYVGTLIRLSLSWTIGFLGLSSAAKGLGRGLHAAKMHQRHIESDEHLAHQIISDAGPGSAIVLVRSSDPTTRPVVVDAAGAGAMRCWDGTLSDFLAETGLRPNPRLGPNGPRRAAPRHRRGFRGLEAVPPAHRAVSGLARASLDLGTTERLVA